MRIIQPEDWNPCDGIVLEEAANKAVRCDDSHVLVIAGPGAGKTELLSQKAAFLFQTNQCKNPEKILAISFKTDAAQNLKERVIQRCGEDAKGRFSSMTYDAFAKSILDHFMYALPEELRPASDYLVNDYDAIKAAFSHVGYNPHGLKTSKLKTTYDLLLAQVELPIKGSEIRHRVWPLLLQGFDGNKATLTFKMIMKLAMYIVKTNPYIKRALRITYPYVFLDEFQDTTDIQYAFVKECFFDSNVKITAVGDNKQRIMVWAGAVKTIFNDFYNTLNPVGVRLIMNHRSAPKLVELQKAMYASLGEKKTTVGVSDKWNKSDGDITLIIAEDQSVEAASIVADIRDKFSHGTKLNDMCILCKQLPQNYTRTIIEELERYDIRARIETEYQDLIKEPIVELLIKFMACMDNRKHPDEWNYIQESLIELWGIDVSQKNDAYDEMQRNIAELVHTVKEKALRGFDDTQWHDSLEAMLTFFDQEKVKAKYPAYRQGTRFDDLICKFEKLFFKEITVANKDLQLAIENFCGEHSIPIMTIHKSKGLEYSAVYFIGLEDSAFWNFKNQPEEDRCAFFVALSRAKKAVTFTFCQYRNNLKYPLQKRNAINEFFDLLQKPGIAEVKYINKPS